MPSFSDESLEKLKTCDALLRVVFNEVIKHFDCIVLCGFRNQTDQDAAFASGASKLRWPLGEHNKIPSKAVDVVPYPIDWNDTDRMRFFAGFVLGIATTMQIKLRWGGDWDCDTKTKDNKFQDLLHFELED